MQYNKDFAMFGFLIILLCRLAAGVDQTVADYINQKIQRTLNANPEITNGNNLAAEFNSERSKLQAALIPKSGSDEDVTKAEQALDNFQMFAQKYTIIDTMLQNVLNDLIIYQANNNNPLEGRYMALMLQNQLMQAVNLNDAERLLKQYNEVNGTATNGSSPGSAPGSTASTLPPGYGPYFEEIIKILKEYFGKNSPQMTSILERILAKPKLIKDFYYKAKEILGKEEDDKEHFNNLLKFFS